MKTQVIIIGGGPSGLLLSQLLMKSGIQTTIIEKQSRNHVLNRIRAGVIEPHSIKLLNHAEIGDRILREGHVHSGTVISSGDRSFRIDFEKTTGQSVTVFGQTEITRDLYTSQDKANATILHKVKDVVLKDLYDQYPSVEFELESGTRTSIKADFIIGCDGFHGVSRNSIPKNKKKIYEKIYPFGWLGILSETPPVNEELIYSNSASGFALASMRNKNLSRYYIQCPLDTTTENYSDKMFWEELKKRLPSKYVDNLITGKSVEKSIAPLRSFVCEPIQWGKLFLVGDAAHIVPPTGAKGLNLAFSDVYYISEALIHFYNKNNDNLLINYSQTALKRIWKTVRFSWWMTNLLHTYPSSTDFEKKLQLSEIEHLASSEKAQASLAENYVGLPY